MSLAPGTKLGPYEIQSLIGEGGMGEVYRAHDARLNRTVAIKRVPDSHADRFETEARAIAALNHPHICQIYDVGPDYLVLEYLHGEPLQGPVAPDDAVTLALQMAEALEAAHERGILHRDLKPANVMVLRRGGTPTVKLLDFGIARLAAVDADSTRTAAGALVGTPAYMSPEQAQDKPLDARSDVFSFGAVLYELLAGVKAFAGDSTAEVLSAVLRDEPRRLEVPRDLQQIVNRCLAKEAARRFQSMRDVKAALQQLRLDRHDVESSIAVLPFANLSADKENEYFGDGLAEEIINALAQVEDLKVIARTSAFAFKGKNEDVRSIAQALGVTHVLEGSVRRAGDRLRVTAQLITAADGTHLWSERFDRPITDVFAMQDEIAQAITTALQGRLAGDAEQRRRYKPRVAAYDAFLKGRAHLSQFTPDAWQRARACFTQAIRLDPRFAEPHAELALGLFMTGMHGLQPMREVAPEVRRQAERALTLDPADQRPRVLLGAVALALDYDWETARAHFDAAMTGPDVSAHARWIYASLYLRGLGRFSDAVAEMTRAVEQDPLNATWHAMLAAHLIDADRCQQAIAAGRRAVELEPAYLIAHNLLGEAYWAAGERDQAIASFERTLQLAPWSTVASSWLAATRHQQGQGPAADELNTPRGPLPLWGRVVYYLLISDFDRAAEWYGRMVETRDPFALIYAKSSMIEPLHHHPAWPKLAAEMRLPA